MKRVRKLSDRHRQAIKAEVLAAFDRQVASPAKDRDMISGFLEIVIGGFEWLRWPEAAMRSVLIAYLDVAPDEDLLTIRARAADETAWVEDHEVRREYLKATGKDADAGEPEFEAWKQARARKAVA